jgi:hypothetical protein
MLIGIASVKPQVGKSTTSEYLERKYGFTGSECSDFIVYLAKKYFGFNGNKLDPDQRKVLQHVGIMGRDIDPVLWIYYSLSLHEYDLEKSNWETLIDFREACDRHGF